MKAPDKVTCVEWIKKAWSTVTADVIIKFFKACGISSSTDGSDDSSIHCLKPGGVAHSALETTTEGTASLNNSYEWDEEDPFADCDTELEDDETLIGNLCTLLFFCQTFDAEYSNLSVLDFVSMFSLLKLLIEGVSTWA